MPLAGFVAQHMDSTIAQPTGNACRAAEASCTHVLPYTPCRLHRPSVRGVFNVIESKRRQLLWDLPGEPPLQRLWGSSV